MKKYNLLFVSGPEEEIINLPVESSSKKAVFKDFMNALKAHEKEESFLFQGHEIFTQDFLKSSLSFYVLPPLVLTPNEVDDLDLDVETAPELLMNQKKCIEEIKALFPLTVAGAKYFELEQEYNEVLAEMLDLRLHRQDKTEVYKIAENKKELYSRQMRALLSQKLYK